MISRLYKATRVENHPVTGTLKPRSNGPLYRNTVIGTLAVDGWPVTFGTARMHGPGRAAVPPSPLLAVPNVTAYSLTASVRTSYYSRRHHSCVCTIMITWGPPMTNLPDGCRWKTVWESMYCRGMTAVTTLSINCLRSCDVVTSSECCTETTTVWTRTGTHAPFSIRYSHVTWTLHMLPVLRRYHL